MEKEFRVRCRAVILDGDKLLVVRHAAKSENYWALPGGHLEWGEDVRDGLVREIVEELGVVPELGPLLFIHTFVRDAVHSLEFFFRVENPEAFRVLGVEPTHAYEIDLVEWITVEDTQLLRPYGIAEAFKLGQLRDNTLRYLS